MLGEDERAVFLGDQIYGKKHCFLANGFYQEWLGNIEFLRERFPRCGVPRRCTAARPARPTGIGNAATSRPSSTQARAPIGSNAEQAHASIVATMTRYLPTDELLFLMELSIEPLADQLGLSSALGR